MTLIVCPLHEVETAAARYAPSHILTLVGPLAETPKCATAPKAQRLHILFNDIVEPTEGLVLATAGHVDEMIAFGRSWDPSSPMLVHCWAGISRSTAGAYIIAADREGPGSEERLAQALRAASPIATPNRHLIALADAALDRGGAMSRAINAIGRGEEAPANTTFELPFGR